MTKANIHEAMTASLLFSPKAFFAKNVLIENFKQMQELLGGECFAITLPHEILLWCSVQKDRKPSEHTLSILKQGYREHYYGNLLFTSDDEDSFQGIRSLSEHQIKWLGKQCRIVESPLSGDSVFDFHMDEEASN